MLSLHIHSEYSTKDAISKIEEIALKHKEMGLNKFALTDHGVMSGFPEAFEVAKKHDMMFIPGCEFYLEPNGDYDLKIKTERVSELRKLTARKRGVDPEEREKALKELDYWDSIDARKNYHLTVLAYNQTGLDNLFKIFNEGNLYYKHRITTESLFNHSEGLIVLSGCFGSEFSFYVKSRQIDKAKELAKSYKEKFGDNYYIEIQYHELEQFEREARKGYMKEIETYNTMIQIAKELDISMVCTNDSHFINKEDQKLHDIYKAICYHKTADQQSGDMGFSGQYYHIMTETELRNSFELAGYQKSDVDSMIKNVEKIYNQIEPMNIRKANKLIDQYDKLYDEVVKGWENKRKGTPIEQESWDRIQTEMKVIKEKNFSTYFLNMKLIVDTAYECGILTGPGRGSAAGSEIVYLIGITKTDPLKYGLMFERFLNPDRFEMPDIDLDLSFAPNGELGSTHVVNVLKDRFKFNGRIANVSRGSSLCILVEKSGLG